MNLLMKPQESSVKKNVLKDIISTIKNNPDISKMKQSFVMKAGEALNAYRCFIFMYDSENNKILPIDQYSEYKSSNDVLSMIDVELDLQAHMPKIVKQKKHLIISDIQKYFEELPKRIDADLNHDLFLLEKYNIKSGALFPIIFAGQLLGVFGVQYSKARSYSEEEIDFIKTITNQAGIGIYQAKLIKQIKENNIKEKLLQKIVFEIKNNDNIDKCIQTICEEIAKAFNIQRIMILDYNAKETPTLLNEYVNINQFDSLSKESNKNLYKLFNKSTINTEKKLIIDDSETIQSEEKLKKELNKFKIRSLISIPLKTAEGNKGCIILMNQDYAKKWAEFEISTLNQIAEYISMTVKETYLEIQSNFIANISHEIKTPLSIIDGYTEELLSNIKSNDDEAQNNLLIIKRNVNRINSIIENFLFISKLERDLEVNNISFYEYKMKKIFEFAIEMSTSLLEEKGINIKIDCDENLIVKVNILLLQQALVNLISNAIKHNENLSLITIKGLQNNSESIIKVKDDGCGIAKGQLEKIFEKFYKITEPQSKTTGGTGLGLSIVKLIAKTHKGYITLESKKGIGTEFTIHLPRGQI